jgi:ribonucleotide reductase alpha subunit
LAGVNSGIEPYFAFEYTRRDRTGEHKILAEIVKEFEGETKRDFLVSAMDVSVEEHIAVQAAVQKYIDSSVSKTINAPNSHTVEDVEKAYMLAYKSGLKGVAYFRDGCGRAQVLSTDNTEDESKKELFRLRGIINQMKSLLDDGKTFSATLSLATSPLDMGTQDQTACPSCGGEVVYQEGCKKCPACGWAAC